MPLKTLIKVMLGLEAEDFYLACGAKELARSEHLHARTLASMHNLQLPDSLERQSCVTLPPTAAHNDSI